MSNSTSVDQEFNLLHTIATCTYNSYFKSVIAATRYSIRRDSVFYGKTFSTFISQEIRCLVTKFVSWGVNSLDLAADVFESIKFLPVMIGTGVMYGYRYVEEYYRDHNRHEGNIKFSASLGLAAFLTGSLISHLASYVKDTTFSKLPNLIYSYGFSHFKNINYQFNLWEFIDDIFDALWVAEFQNDMKKTMKPVEEFISDYFSEDEEKVTIITHQNTTRVKVELLQMHNNCPALDGLFISNTHQSQSSDKSPSSKDFLVFGSARSISIEQEFPNLDCSDVDCCFPCLGINCNSFIRYFNVSRNEYVKLPNSDLSSCPVAFKEELSSILHGLVLECENLP